MKVKLWVSKSWNDMEEEVIEVDDDTPDEELKHQALSHAFHKADIEYGYEKLDNNQN